MPYGYHWHLWYLPDICDTCYLSQISALATFAMTKICITEQPSYIHLNH